jgi:hypothetical protein
MRGQDGSHTTQLTPAYTAHAFIYSHVTVMFFNQLSVRTLRLYTSLKDVYVTILANPLRHYQRYSLDALAKYSAD